MSDDVIYSAEYWGKKEALAEIILNHTKAARMRAALREDLKVKLGHGVAKTRSGLFNQLCGFFTLDELRSYLRALDVYA